MARWAWGIGVVAWMGAVSAGFASVWSYASAPGVGTRAPATWPEASRLRLARDRATLLMFVHPRCPCSRASLADLEGLLSRTRGLAAPVVVFVRPRGVEAGWERSELRRSAERIPGAAVVDDDGGEEARRFGALTSGACLLYDAGGRLAFSGGITSVRGHEGKSFGEERIVALLTGVAADRRDSPVFGCPLDDEPTTKESAP